jgi:hypothetical protein
MYDLNGIRKKHNIPDDIASCHIAIIKKYVIEGHVPASDIKKILKEKSDVLGLYVSGMPIGSPGMEQGSVKEPFNVYAILPDGKLKVYNSY